MIYLVTTVHVLLCIFLIVVVLLQSGKAADLAGAFGGMGSQTVFGPRGTATVLSKATTVAATLFMITSLTLVVLSNKKNAGSGKARARAQIAGRSCARERAHAPACESAKNSLESERILQCEWPPEGPAAKRAELVGRFTYNKKTFAVVAELADAHA